MKFYANFNRVFQLSLVITLAVSWALWMYTKSLLNNYLMMIVSVGFIINMFMQALTFHRLFKFLKLKPFTMGLAHIILVIAWLSYTNEYFLMILNCWGTKDMNDKCPS